MYYNLNLNQLLNVETSVCKEGSGTLLRGFRLKVVNSFHWAHFC